MDKASCKGLDTNMFYPGKGSDGYVARKKIKAICNTCPVVLDCLEYALETERQLGRGEYYYGWWGGCSPTQRMVLNGWTIWKNISMENLPPAVAEKYGYTRKENNESK